MKSSGGDAVKPKSPKLWKKQMKRKQIDLRPVKANEMSPIKKTKLDKKKKELKNKANISKENMNDKKKAGSTKSIMKKQIKIEKDDSKSLKSKETAEDLKQTMGNKIISEKSMDVDSANKKVVKKKVSFVTDQNSSMKTEKPPNKKRKNPFGDSSPPKKPKAEGLKGKERKMLHLNKKKNKNISTDTDTKNSKDTPKSVKYWREIHMKQKGKEIVLQQGKALKNLWEELRRDDCKPERKSQLLKQACDLLKGRVKEFTFAHDTVRVLECIIAEGSLEHRDLLFNEMQGDIIPLAKSKYGKFFLLKILRYGTKQQKETVIKAFHGKVVKLLRHTEAAEVIEMAFNECTNATQRSKLVQEFYGPTYKFFKTSEYHNLAELLEKEPEKKASIIQHMKDELVKLTEKTVIKHSIVHHLLWQFMTHSDPQAKAEVIESIRDAVPEILHSKDGSKAAMHCLWFGTQKDRKVIVKSMKTFVAKIAKEEHGHMVLLALFDCVDDTKLLEKCIVLELVKSLEELAKDTHGKKVLIYLLSHRDPHFINPQVVDILKKGDGNPSSKKDPEIRAAELKKVIEKPLLDHVTTNISELYTDNAFCAFALTVLQCISDKREACFRAIAELVSEPYTSDTKDSHLIEHSGSSFFLKKLIVHDAKTKDQVSETFSEILVQVVPKLVFKTWVECNRGAFLLVSLLETQIPSVVERINKDLAGLKTHLKKKATSSKGVEILLKKLKD